MYTSISVLAHNGTEFMYCIHLIQGIVTKFSINNFVSAQYETVLVELKVFFVQVDDRAVQIIL